jgi:4-methoxybenzoate monooxygenase (O-demethylating)
VPIEIFGQDSVFRTASSFTLRFDSSAPYVFRTTSQQTEIASVPIGKHEKVLLLLASANRDEGRWERPDELDITRRVAGHIGFGTGIYGCIGQMVARLEGEAVLAALATRVASIEIVGDAVYRDSSGLRALSSLPCVSCGNSDAVQPAAASRISFSTLASSPRATASASALP